MNIEVLYENAKFTSDMNFLWISCLCSSSSVKSRSCNLLVSGSLFDPLQNIILNILRQLALLLINDEGQFIDNYKFAEFSKALVIMMTLLVIVIKPKSSTYVFKHNDKTLSIFAVIMCININLKLMFLTSLSLEFKSIHTLVKVPSCSEFFFYHE